MKKSRISITILLLAGLFSTKAQVAVNQYNDVFLGYTTTPSINYATSANINGGLSINSGNFTVSPYTTARFNGDGEGSDLLIENNGQDASILPEENNSGYIGKSGQQFYEMRAYRIFANGTYLGSDSKIKKNVKEVESPLEKVKKLKGKQYDLKLP